MWMAAVALSRMFPMCPTLYAVDQGPANAIPASKHFACQSRFPNLDGLGFCQLVKGVLLTDNSWDFPGAPFFHHVFQVVSVCT